MKCHNDAICENGVGEFNCACVAGFFGGGFECLDSDEPMIIPILMVITTVTVTTVTLVMVFNNLISMIVTRKLTMIVMPMLNVQISLDHITVPALTSGLALDSMTIVLIWMSANAKDQEMIVMLLIDSVSMKMVNKDTDVTTVSLKIVIMGQNVLTGTNETVRMAVTAVTPMQLA